MNPPAPSLPGEIALLSGGFVRGTTVGLPCLRWKRAPRPKTDVNWESSQLADSKYLASSQVARKSDSVRPKICGRQGVSAVSAGRAD